MKFIVSKLQTLILVFTILLSIKHYNSQSIEDLIRPKCTSQSISYSILANLSEYLENENNIDGREIYKNIEDLKSKRVGTTKDIYFNESNFKFDSLNRAYDSYDSLIEDLRAHNLDAIISYSSNTNYTRMYTNDLLDFKFLEEQLSSFGIQKGNTTLFNQVNDVLGNTTLINAIGIKWLGVNYQTKYIDKNLAGNNGILNIAVKANDLMYCYKDNNGELLGLDVEVKLMKHHKKKNKLKMKML